MVFTVFHYTCWQDTVSRRTTSTVKQQKPWNLGCGIWDGTPCYFPWYWCGFGCMFTTKGWIWVGHNKKIICPFTYAHLVWLDCLNSHLCDDFWLLLSLFSLLYNYFLPWELPIKATLSNTALLHFPFPIIHFLLHFSSNLCNAVWKRFFLRLCFILLLSPLI